MWKNSSQHNAYADVDAAPKELNGKTTVKEAVKLGISSSQNLQKPIPFQILIGLLLWWVFEFCFSLVKNCSVAIWQPNFPIPKNKDLSDPGSVPFAEEGFALTKVFKDTQNVLPLIALYLSSILKSI